MLWLGVSLSLVVVLAASSKASDTTAESMTKPPEEPEERVEVRFRDATKPVKVVVLAGSIGAYRRAPYARQLAQTCSRAEFFNLSKTGLGAWALKKRFEKHVLRGRTIAWNTPGQHFWLLFGGGLNSVVSPERTISHTRSLIVDAHKRGMRVAAMTLTPWGDLDDRRWRGVSALKYRLATQKIADFVLGKLSPQEALGASIQRREEAGAPWLPHELPDIGIDLYDSPLRHRAATARPLSEVREQLRKSADWQRQHRQLAESDLEAQLNRDAMILANVPQWFLREELRSFDHIHPNELGHRLIAQMVCRQAPPAWGCDCEALEEPYETAAVAK